MPFSLARFLATAVMALLCGAALSAPLVDHHQHLFSPEIVARSPGLASLSARDLVALLDSAGIERALVLSTAYQLGNPNKPVIADEYARVRSENDWTSRQVGLFPGRLRGFCGFNPLKEYAIAEVERCAGDPRMRFGIKLHFGNSDVDLTDPTQVEQLVKVFKAAANRNMAVAVHMRPSVTRNRPYGAAQARIFLNELIGAAPGTVIQIAHLAGAGGYDDPSIDEALSVFVEAVERDDPRMAHLYFDVSGVAGVGDWRSKASLVARRIRQLGVQRVLYGSDGAVGGGMTPAQGGKAFRELPLTEREFREIESNVAPYMR